MLNPFFESVVTVLLSIGIVAGIALLVSRKSQTPQVLQAAWSGYSNALGVAESPVTGATYHIDLSYPATNGFNG
jgi:hypothetical protein